MQVVDFIRPFVGDPLPVAVTAYDGSRLGPLDAPVTLHLAGPDAMRFLVTSPGELGLGRAYVAGQLVVEGGHPGDPYGIVLTLRDIERRQPSAAEIAHLVRNLDPSWLRRPALPPQEAPARWRRTLRHVQTRLGVGVRAAKSIEHHYDVSNAFYEMVLGPSMTYTCAVYASPDDSLELAQERKYALVADKLGLRPGMTLLDVGCGWGGMVRFAARELGVRALGVTLSRQQAEWAQATIVREGLDGLAEVRHCDYRDAPWEQYDAISSIGLTEHIGVRNYPSYFSHLLRRLRPGGRLLNHSITRANSLISPNPDAFIDRYVFPDGQTPGVTTIMAAMQNAGFEMIHEENIRESYALTLAAWGRNLQDNWDACVAEVGPGTCRVWGLYMAGSRFAFAHNDLNLHQVLAVRPLEDGRAAYPLRPDWNPNPR